MSNTVYNNFVLENKFESELSTKLNLQRFLKVDRSLAEAAGMKKTINVYTASGNVEDLAQGVGNSAIIEGAFVGHDYTVGVTQGKGRYFDEEAMKDPFIVDTIIKGMAEKMANDFTSKAIAEMGKFQLCAECDFSTTTSGYFFGKVVDALAKLGEDQEGYNMIISPVNLAYVRKQLADDLKYSEGFARTGYVGSVCGIPVFVSKACPNSCAFIVNNEAVTLFLKKESEAEQDRNPNTRENDLYIRKVALVAMTNATKIVALAKAQSTACAITTYTKAAKTIAGTCGADCYLVHVVDGDGIGYDVVPSNGTWTMSAKENLTAGDKINAIAYENGKAPKAATEVTVAA